MNLLKLEKKLTESSRAWHRINHLAELLEQIAKELREVNNIRSESLQRVSESLSNKQNDNK